MSVLSKISACWISGLKYYIWPEYWIWVIRVSFKIYCINFFWRTLQVAWTIIYYVLIQGFVLISFYTYIHISYAFTEEAPCVIGPKIIILSHKINHLFANSSLDLLFIVWDFIQRGSTFFLLIIIIILFLLQCLSLH